MFPSLEFRIWEPPGLREKELLGPLLARSGLVFEGTPELSVVAETPEGEVMATGSLEGTVLRMVAVDPRVQEGGLASAVISRLLEEARSRGRHHLFVFTKPDSAERFSELGFVAIARFDPHVVLLEMGEPNVETFRKHLRRVAATGVNGAIPGEIRGAIVMNANPFTLGHRHLVQEARARCDRLFIVVVETDRSAFPFAVRRQLVQEGVADLPGVAVLGGGEYSISSATFPTYFLKHLDDAEQIRLQARLDSVLFSDLFGRELGLSRRFVGTEPLCPVTALYNEALLEILPPRGIEVTVIPRKTDSGGAISASSVRRSWVAEDWEALRRLVPPSTERFLRDQESRPIWERLRRSSGRH